MAFKIILLVCLSVISAVRAQDDEGIYSIGAGIGDITGPPAGVVLNGYVNPITYANGIYTRQFARAFVIQSKTDGKLISYVTCDMGMMDHTIKIEVLKRLQVLHPGLFTAKNLMISATHTHSGVSGFMTYYAYLIIESYGFNPLTFWSAVEGVTEAVSRAVKSQQDGRLWWNSGDLLNANNNRRREQYEANLDKHLYEYNVDKEMVLLKMAGVDGSHIGAFTWWPVHPISFNGGINPLVSSDNKGYAAILFDQRIEPNMRPGKGKFVSGFGSSNLGDVSSDHSQNDNSRIDFNKDINDTRIMGMKQFNKAWELYNDDANLMEIKGPVKFVHTFMDTTTVSVEVPNNEGVPETLKLCTAALGFSYVGLEPSPLWEWIRDNIIAKPDPETVICQAPKEIALDAGHLTEPWQWAPSIVALQILQVGAFDIVATPGEYTTMAGRRVRNAVYNVTGHKVVIAGLANDYINYIATPEEYDFVDYEGGATLYGRNTLPVTAAVLADMAQAMEDNTEGSYPAGPNPPTFLDIVRSEIEPRMDAPSAQDGPFGTVLMQPYPEHFIGEELFVRFAAASPRHSPMRGGTFFLIERLDEETNKWEVIRTDADVDTTFWWNPIVNRAEIKWTIAPDTEPGTFRIRHFGYWLPQVDQEILPYSGSTRNFQIKARTS